MAGPNWQRRLPAALIAVLTMCLAVAPAAATTWQPVALKDGAAPGIPGEPAAKFEFLEPPAINDAGKVAFHSIVKDLTGSLHATADTIWAGAPGSLQVAARVGTPAPGTASLFEMLITAPLINNAGQVLFQAEVSGSGSQNSGLWVGAPGSTQLLARIGTSYPGFPHTIDSIDFFNQALGDGGHSAFVGRGSDLRHALYAGTPAGLSIVAINDQPVPTSSGLPAGTEFSALSLLRLPAINANGVVAFEARVDGPSLFETSVWTGAPGNLKLLARGDQAAPGAPGFEFASIDSAPLLNNANQVAFKATLENDDGLWDSIWLGAPNNLALVVRGGQPAPVAPGFTFSDFIMADELRLNDAGQIAFQGSFEGPGVTLDDDQALFVASVTGATMVAREGRQPPGAPAGTVLSLVTSYALNNDGRLAFSGWLEGPGITSQNRNAVWAQSSDGTLNLVAQEGDWVHPTTGVVVPQGEVVNAALLESQGYASIRNIDVRFGSWAESEFGSGWNDLGQLAFLAELNHPTIGEAIFVANVNGATLDGDFDFDGDVDGADLLLWQREIRTPAGLAAWRTNFGLIVDAASSTPLEPTTAVPEPAALALAACCAVVLVRRPAI
jgi:hypothetical protein